MIHLIHGPEDLLRSEELRTLQAALDLGPSPELNTSQLQGSGASLGELQQACDTVPFLAPHRLVIVDSLLGGSSDRGEEGLTSAQKRVLQGLTEYLPHLPDTTVLVFVEPQKLDRRNPVLRYLQTAAQRQQAHIVDCEPKKGHDLTQWIESQVSKAGAQIDREAAQMLAQVAGNNLRLLAHEIDKLVSYTAGAAPISAKDVLALVPEAREVTVWEMVDGLGRGDGATAIAALHRLLDEDEHPLRLLAMIIRQYRLLLQTKELVARGLRKTGIADRLQLKEWAADKLMRQAHRYSLSDLEAIYGRLLEIDLSIKTGRLEPVLALDLLIAELSS